MNPAALRVATRASPLALAQVDLVEAALGHRVERVAVSTAGDRHTDVALHQLGGQGLFVKEVQRAVLEGVADIAVHSAKDLPSITPSDLALVGYLERADPRDCLVGTGWSDLGVGATVATGSVRRQRLLAELRPDLRFVDLRGNMARRLEQVPAGGAVVAARAALVRLGWADRCASTFSTDELLPQVGQGAIAIECRADSPLRAQLAAVCDRTTGLAVTAERAYLEQLGAGCEIPVAAHARVVGGVLDLEVWLAGEPGAASFRRREQRRCVDANGAAEFGAELGHAAAAWRDS